MIALSGRIVSGRAVATKHLSECSDELELILGENPYPGSLNVILDKPLKLSKSKAIRFDGGRRLLWPARINGVPAWLYRWDAAPLHVAEFLAPFRLRERIGRNTEDRVAVEVDEAFIERAPLLAWSLIWAGRRDWPYTRDGYSRVVEKVSGKTGFTMEPPTRVIEKTARGILKKFGLVTGRRPYPFSRVPTESLRQEWRETKQVLNLLNYTKSSNTSYSAQAYPAGYHSLQIHGRTFKGQRAPAARLQHVPLQFEGKTVLDLGCNQGGMLHELAERITWGVGVDFDHRMVNAANRIKAIRRTENLSFYVFDLQREDLKLLRDLLPDDRVDVTFLLSVCMWIPNWREVIDFAASISDSILFESNGTDAQQHAQIQHLERCCGSVALLAGESKDDPGQQRRKLLLARV